MNTTTRHRALVRMYGCPARSTTTIKGMNSPDKRHNNTVAVTVIISSAVVILGVFLGAFALSYAGRDLGAIVGLIAPVGAAAGLLVAALGQLAALGRKQEQQAEKLDEVAHQTNGALREHIDRSIRSALDRHLGDRHPQ
jgi:hypothetical protein